MKEMVGGCCVCSDERGWPENPLVYCDGQNCTVAVHQACYGIVTVPTGVSRGIEFRCDITLLTSFLSHSIFFLALVL